MSDFMSRSSDRLRSPGEGPRQARPKTQETTMPKYLLLKHYRGGPEPHRPVPPMGQWAPEDVEAHMAFLKHVSELLEENGEYVDAQALTPARPWVRYGGPDAAPVTTDRPLPETNDLVAGQYLLPIEGARTRRGAPSPSTPCPAATEEGADPLLPRFRRAHPDLAPASQVALTLRAVGGLTTREIADAFYVPEATMAQRISRAKRALQGRRLDQPGDLAVVLRVLYLVYTAGHAGRVDLAGEAIRLARQLTLATEEPEARGLLALMLLNYARLPARLDSEGRIVTLDRQDRGLWDTREIAEGVRVLQSALAVQRPGRYQVEAAIAALHDDAASAEETDWAQILAWYDDLVALTDDPVREDPAAVLGRAVAVGHVLGAAAGLREPDRLREVLAERHGWHAVRGHLHELGGDLPAAATAYAEAARRATNVAERDHLVRQAARARAAALCRNSRLTERPP